jgi:hypothetical protein
MVAGDVAVIPGNTEHEGLFPEDTEVIDIFAGPRLLTFGWFRRSIRDGIVSFLFAHDGVEASAPKRFNARLVDAETGNHLSAFLDHALGCSSGRWEPRNQEERNMLHIMHRVYGPALPAAILLIGIGAMGMGGAAAQGSPEARQACTPDAMRLCSEFTSDVSLTTKCMMAKRAQWSPECRAAMAHGTSHRAYRHYYRHYRHCTHGYCR